MRVKVVCYRYFDIFEWRGNETDVKITGVVSQSIRGRISRKRHRWYVGEEGTKQTDGHIFNADE